MKDSYGRKIDYMRVSVTDRCNLRCRYCVTEDFELFARNEILSWEEILLVFRAAARAGITKAKITGGEPLVRKGCPDFVGKLKAIPGIEQVTMTTNGVLLEQFLPELLESGLDAVNISIDTLDRRKFEQVTGRDRLPEVLKGLQAAVRSPLRVKVNTVLQKEDSDSMQELFRECEEMIDLAKDLPVDVRFIEMMPVGNGSAGKGVSNTVLRKWIAGRFEGVKEDQRVHGNGPAVYDRIPGYRGSVGFISAIHGKFCKSCNRIRMSSTGEIKPCLCYADSIPLKAVLRDESLSEAEKESQLTEAIERAVKAKPQEHCFENIMEITEAHKMNQIGG